MTQPSIPANRPDPARLYADLLAELERRRRLADRVVVRRMAVAPFVPESTDDRAYPQRD